MAVNGWQPVEMRRETRTATMRVWKDETGSWRAQVTGVGGVALGGEVGFKTPGEAMDWADDLWRSKIP